MKEKQTENILYSYNIHTQKRVTKSQLSYDKRNQQVYIPWRRVTLEKHVNHKT